MSSPHPPDPGATRDRLPLFGRTRVLLPTGDEAAAFDARSIDESGVPGPVLMENAGRSAALVLDRVLPRGRVLVLAGPGNNGGDGVVVARTLRGWGREVRWVAVNRPARDPLLHGLDLPGEPWPGEPRGEEALLSWADVVVDGLLGTGLRGPARDPFAGVIRAVNRASRPVLALDLPSGVEADTGASPGESMAARVTVAFGAPKLGTLLHPGRERTGRLVAVEIGFPPWPDGAAGARLITPEWVGDLRPRRALRTHKNAQGRLLVLAGSEGMAGAAVLAARGALRAGAGFVRVASSPAHRPILQTAVPEAVFVDAHDAGALREAARASDALAAGPGMGTDPDAARRLEDLLAREAPPALLLDADALTLLGAGSLPGFPGAATPARRLLTPHPGEVARILEGTEPAGEGGSGAAGGNAPVPLSRARAAARRWASVCLLKGTPSVVAAPDDESVRVSATGSSDLARAGMGDVLTGVAGAMLARGLSALDAATVALHLTGRGAALAPRGGEALLPSDVVDALPSALAARGPGTSDLNLPFVLLDLGPPR
jgi:ADP-dependent NAD(P)H-hydrate dehydratase / NAD(P)H-hydrate epimerase